MAAKNPSQRRRAKVEAQRKMLKATKQSSVRETKLVKASARSEGGKSRAAGKPPAEKKIPGNEEMHGHKGESQGGVTIPLIKRIGQKRESRPPSQSRVEAEELGHKNGKRIGQKRTFRTRSHSRAEAEESRRRNQCPQLVPVLPHQGERKVVLESSCRGEVLRAQGKRKRKPYKKKEVEGKVIPVAKVASIRSHSRAEAEELSRRNRCPELLPVPPHQGERKVVLESSCRGEVLRAQGKRKRKPSKKKKVEGKVIPVAKVATSNEGPRAESKSKKKRKKKKKKKKKIVEEKVPAYGGVGWKEGPRALGIVRRWISNSGGDPKKLKVDDCKSYLRYHGLRISGTKPLLVDRIKEHIQLKEGGSKLYDRSTFNINCTGDVCKGDVIRFKHLPSVSNSAKRVFKPSIRTVVGRIVSESYGTKQHQHTFTVEILWSTGYPPLSLMKQLLVKGRKLYRRGTFRQKWEDEGERDKTLAEKHERGAAARKFHATRQHTFRGNVRRAQSLRKPRIKLRARPDPNQALRKPRIKLRARPDPNQGL